MTAVSLASLPFHLEDALADLAEHDLASWVPSLEHHISHVLKPGVNGNLPRWLDTLRALPRVMTASYDFASPVVRVGSADGSIKEKQQLERLLMSLSPWRKGPFEVQGISIDSEWRSDWKWDRLASSIAPLNGRKVLDIGCGNGYYALRMVGAGAQYVVGIDPSLLVLSQFTAICRGLKTRPPVAILPVGIDQVPDRLPVFDTVFSMGVLYHRRSPLDHLYHLKHLLRPQGELVLETLVVDGGLGNVLVPADRYAQMRNVWFLPSVDELVHWLKRIGFKTIECVNVAVTTTEEQRRTPWMRFHSLSHYLDSNDPALTVEGYPAPKRAVVIAKAP